jgi:hypothetical protein
MRFAGWHRELFAVACGRKRGVRCGGEQEPALSQRENLWREKLKAVVSKVKTDPLSIDAAKNGIIIDTIEHQGMNADYRERWDDFFMDHPKATEPQIRAYATHLASEEFADAYAAASEAPMSYQKWNASSLPPGWKGLGRAGAVIGVLGAVGMVAGAAGAAENLACDLKQFAQDKANGQDAWAYADALMARQDANAISPFAGDVAMRAMYGGK